MSDPLVQAANNLPNCWVWICDIRKAFDNVDLNLLNELIIIDAGTDTDVLNEWNWQYNDLRDLDMDVSGEVIKRTYGLPQGAELSPLLFNYFMTKVFEQLDIVLAEYKILSSCAYADNLLFIIDIRNNINKFMDDVKKVLADFNLALGEKDQWCFQLKEVRDFENMNGTPTRDEIYKYFNRLESHDGTAFTFLGWHFKVFDQIITWNVFKSRFNFCTCNPQPGYKAIKFFKTYIASKFRYQYKYMSPYYVQSAAIYRRWFYLESRIWFMKTCLILTLHNKLFDWMIDISEKKKDDLPKDYLTYWLQKEDYYATGREQVKLDHLQKMVDLAKANKHLGIYSTMNFIFYNQSNELPSGTIPLDIESERTRKRFWSLLDDAYFAITTDTDPEILISKNQEAFCANKIPNIYLLKI